MKHVSMFNPGQLLAAVAAITVLSAPLSAVAVDAEAAVWLARRENCLKCHAVDKKKSGPSYKQVAARHRGKPDAEERLIEHLRSGKTVTLSNGDEEEHRIIKNADEKEIRNLVQWILSLE